MIPLDISSKTGPMLKKYKSRITTGHMMKTHHPDERLVPGGGFGSGGGAMAGEFRAGKMGQQGEGDS